ncbi:hypothetical protein F9T53_18865, partial [Shigella dysenteriae]|nr:hypothetical protein [Shigella dysenteriae]
PVHLILINEEKPYSSPLPPPYLYYSLMYVRKLRRKIIKKKRIFACCFVFARLFPEIIRVLQLFHLLLKNGLVIAQDELWVL